jgi:UDP-sulfoquinovose synthase
MRRKADKEFRIHSLVPILSLKKRTALWEKITQKKIQTYNGSTLQYGSIKKCLASFQPDAIVHFAEQRTAPYSMLDRNHAIYTMENNVLGTLNVLYAIKETNPSCHLVKLGTMGEYGTPNIDIEEGFITIKHKGRTDTLPYPKQAGSFYHLSKVHDSNNIQFCCKIWELRSTDLNQGVVYGISTDQTDKAVGLSTRFDYDQIYGTALNRFCCQAAIGYPLTIHGLGKQIRSYINIKDTVRCIELAILNPPELGEYRVFNQFTQQFSLLELAAIVKKSAKKIHIHTSIQHIPNPRVEKETHYYNAHNTSLLSLGLKPHLLTEECIISLIQTAQKYKTRIDEAVIRPTINWRKTNNEI